MIRFPHLYRLSLLSSLCLFLVGSIAGKQEVSRQDESIILHAGGAQMHATGTIRPVFDHTSIRRIHRILANDALSSLPTKCQDTLKDFYVKYDHPERRGLAGKTIMILSGNVEDNDEFRALFFHEFGHIADLGCLEGQPFSGQSMFRDGNEIIWKDDPSASFYSISWVTEGRRKRNSEREDFVSGYAMSDAFEDFAESFAYFVLQHDTFKIRAQENTALRMKFEWLEQNLFSEFHLRARGQHAWNGVVPWDVTKLPYEWETGETIALQ